MKSQKRILNESGQSTIEFIFSFSFAFFIIIYTIKVALNYTTGYLVHYATYMSSRAYLTFEGNGNDTAATLYSQAVEPTFNGTRVDAFNQAIQVSNATLRTTNVSSPQLAVLDGVTFDWETTFSTVGLFGGNQPLMMRSESFLGREPDRKTCSNQTCTAARGTSGSCGRAFTLVDNGC